VARIQAVLFDLGGTLIESRRAEACGAWWRPRGHTVHPEAVRAALYRTDHIFMEHFPAMWRAPGPGFHERYWAAVHAELGLAAPPPAVTAGWGGHWMRSADAARTLEGLRAAGLRVGLVSNWGPGARETLEATGLRPLLDAAVFSCELGVGKPDPGIFLAAARALGVPPRRCLHVGDNCWDDVAGSLAAGMRPVLLHRHPQWCAAPAVPAGTRLVTDLDSVLLLVGAPPARRGQPAGPPRPALAAPQAGLDAAPAPKAAILS